MNSKKDEYIQFILRQLYETKETITKLKLQYQKYKEEKQILMQDMLKQKIKYQSQKNQANQLQKKKYLQFQRDFQSKYQQFVNYTKQQIQSIEKKIYDSQLQLIQLKSTKSIKTLKSSTYLNQIENECEHLKIQNWNLKQMINKDFNGNCQKISNFIKQNQLLQNQIVSLNELIKRFQNEISNNSKIIDKQQKQLIALNQAISIGNQQKLLFDQKINQKECELQKYITKHNKQLQQIQKKTKQLYQSQVYNSKMRQSYVQTQKLFTLQRQQYQKQKQNLLEQNKKLSRQLQKSIIKIKEQNILIQEHQQEIQGNIKSNQLLQIYLAQIKQQMLKRENINNQNKIYIKSLEQQIQFHQKEKIYLASMKNQFENQKKYLKETFANTSSISQKYTPNTPQEQQKSNNKIKRDSINYETQLQIYQQSGIAISQECKDIQQQFDHKIKILNHEIINFEQKILNEKQKYQNLIYENKILKLKIQVLQKQRKINRHNQQSKQREKQNYQKEQRQFKQRYEKIERINKQKQYQISQLKQEISKTQKYQISMKQKYQSQIKILKLQIEQKQIKIQNLQMNSKKIKKNLGIIKKLKEQNGDLRKIIKIGFSSINSYFLQIIDKIIRKVNKIFQSHIKIDKLEEIMKKKEEQSLFKNILHKNIKSTKQDSIQNSLNSSFIPEKYFMKNTKNYLIQDKQDIQQRSHSSKMRYLQIEKSLLSQQQGLIKHNSMSNFRSESYQSNSYKQQKCKHYQTFKQNEYEKLKKQILSQKSKLLKTIKTVKPFNNKIQASKYNNFTQKVYFNR